MKTDTVIYWVASVGPGGKERVPMYFKGRCDKEEEGLVGLDIRARPLSCGPGTYSGTYGCDDFEYEDGSPILPGD